LIFLLSNLEKSLVSLAFVITTGKATVYMTLVVSRQFHVLGRHRMRFTSTCSSIPSMPANFSSFRYRSADKNCTAKYKQTTLFSHSLLLFTRILKDHYCPWSFPQLSWTFKLDKTWKTAVPLESRSLTAPQTSIVSVAILLLFKQSWETLISKEVSNFLETRCAVSYSLKVYFIPSQ